MGCDPFNLFKVFIIFIEIIILYMLDNYETIGKHVAQCYILCGLSANSFYVYLCHNKWCCFVYYGNPRGANDSLPGRTRLIVATVVVGLSTPALGLSYLVSSLSSIASSWAVMSTYVCYFHLFCYHRQWKR